MMSNQETFCQRPEKGAAGTAGECSVAPQAPHASISSGTSGMQRHKRCRAASELRGTKQCRTFSPAQLKRAQVRSVQISSTKLQTGTKKCQPCQKFQKMCAWRRRRRKLKNVAPQAPESAVNLHQNTDFLKKNLNFGRGVPSPPTETGGAPPPT